MTSHRAYRSSMRHAAAWAELRRCAGTQFERRVVDALLTVLDREGERAERTLALPGDSPSSVPVRSRVAPALKSRVA
jgi:HD-GYP domain-containing protein (c-di-GMP phosphodiesterase class II)